MTKFFRSLLERDTSLCLVADRGGITLLGGYERQESRTRDTRPLYEMQSIHPRIGPGVLLFLYRSAFQASSRKPTST